MQFLKKLFFICLILSMFTIGFSQIDNEEFRSTWVITWEHDCDSTKIKTILDNHQKANMNAVLFQVRQSGTAYYNSSYEPWGYYAGYQNPGFDPLTFVVKEAHKRGMEVHAWFNTFQTSSTADGTVAAKHPEWICRDGYNNSMPAHRCVSPGLQEARDYTIDVAMEIVNNYDIDGLHLDYVRWNEFTTTSVNNKTLGKQISEHKLFDGMITEDQIQKLQTTASRERYLYDINHKYSDGVPDGYSNWEEYWRASVTKLVQTLHDSIQSTKPWVRLSVAALGKYKWSGWQAYGSVHQDAALWFNEGYIDQLTPMHYHWTTGTSFKSMLSGSNTSCWEYYIQDGINAGRLFSAGPGSYVLDEYNVWYRHESIIDKTREVQWVDGFQFFSYGSWEGHQYWEEAGNTVFPQKTKIRNNIIYSGDAPSSPSISLAKNDDLNYDITVTPTEVENQWYVIYRSEDADIDPDTDNIIGIKFTNDIFTVNETFSGNQNYNGQYHYSATCLNRYWVESSVSNSQITDDLPSIPPTVTEIYPSNGSIVPANTNIIFTFSKEIDPNTFSSGFMIDPPADINEISISDDWYNSGKVVTITFVNNLQYGETYTITLNTDLTDLNGILIDGNGDGVAGDSFTAEFTTLNEDKEGPVLVYSYPNDSTTVCDPEDIWTLNFNELIDPESINENTVVLKSNNLEINTEPLVTIIDNKSIVTIKSGSQLFADAPVEIFLSSDITDTAGNSMTSNISLTSTTADYYYSEYKMLDNFSGSAGSWWDPEGSGSTVGTVNSKTTFQYSTKIYIPGTNGKSGKISYEWDESANDFLLRDHVVNINTQIDTSYTIQCYVFGDGSDNKFRFALYEKDGGQTAEVSKWKTINWHGWKLVEWDLGELNNIGEWLGNGIMDGGYYQLDGLHLTKGENGSISGAIYIDELRLVKKTPGQAPPNHIPAFTALPDTTIEQNSRLKITPEWTDEDSGDTHVLSASSDTSAIRFLIKGNTSGSIIYISPDSEYFGTTTIRLIVKDSGIGELSDTTEFILTVTQTTAIDEKQIISEYNLEQNYPNPFNPTTEISFTVPQNSLINISIYDLVGRKVDVLVNKKYQPGKYSVNFDASHLASGQYIYQLISNDIVITRKMLLIK